MSSTSAPGIRLQQRSVLLLDVAVLLTASLLYGVLLLLGSGIEAWRHDSLYHVLNYAHDASAAGRWLTYLLRGPLTALPGGLTWLLGQLLFACFAFAVARSYGHDRRAASLFALLVTQIPPVYGQSLWPAQTLLGLVLLVTAALVHQRLRMPAFYVIFGVLFFGVNQQCYFLLPALHLPWISSHPEGRAKALVKLLGLWVVGFLAGYLWALAFVYLVWGQLGLPISTWRDPHPVTDLSSLLDNVASRGRHLAEHLGVWGQHSLAAVTIVAITVVGIVGRRRHEILTRLVVFGAIGLAIYAATIPVGIKIQFRSVLPLFFAFFGFTFLWPLGRTYRRLFPIGVLLVFLSFWTTNLENLRWYRLVTDEYRQELERIAPEAPDSYKGLIVVAGTARGFQTRIEESTGRKARYIVPVLSEESGRDFRWRPSALAAGFRSVTFCAEEDCPASVRDLQADSCILRSSSYCIHGVTPDDFLLLSFAAPSSAPPGQG